MALRDPSWVPTMGWLVVQAVVVSLPMLAAIVVSIVRGVVALPPVGLLGALLPWRDLRRRRAARPAVGPRPVWTVGGEGEA